MNEPQNDGDDGLGFFRGCGWAFVILGTVYLLARYVLLPYIMG